MAQASRLFEPFCRLVSAGEFEGSGIGLATVRKIVDRHGGSIRAKGEPGKGAEITVRLPMAKLELEATQPAPAVSTDSLVAAASTLTRPALLLVDDSPTERLITSRVLDTTFHVCSVDGFSAAVAHLAANTVDVVLSDFDMPEADGLCLLHHVRQEYPSVRRLLTSSMEWRHIQTKPNSDAAQFFLRKSVTAAVVWKALENGAATSKAIPAAE